MATGHYVADRKIEVVLGVTAFVVGSMLIKDAYENRGIPLPRLMRPFSWW